MKFPTRLAIAIAMTAVAVLSTGCASTPQDLRAQGSNRTSFEVDQNYQAVYRTVVTNMRACWQAGMYTAQMVVNADLYSDLKSGHITAAVHGGMGIDTHVDIDIKAIGENRTQVVAYSAYRANRAEAVKQWVTKGGNDCGV